MNLESIIKDFRSRMEGYTDSRQPTADEITIYYLIVELERAIDRIEKLERPYRRKNVAGKNS